MPSGSLTPDPRPGTLYVAATPLGNLKDITLRTLEVLSAVDFVVCEDTRRTRKLLTAHGISRPLVSCHDYNEARQVPAIVRRLLKGESCALATDAGTPMVSDPGYLLVSRAAEAGVPVVPLPGPSAVVAALSASGLPAERFLFAGFLPKKPGARKRALAELAAEPGAVVFYESPQRVAALVKDLAAAWGPRRAVLAREMTKVHEQMLRGTLDEIAAALAVSKVRGECTLVVEGAGRMGESMDRQEVDRVILQELSAQGSVSAAAAAAAQITGRPKREIYQRALVLQKEKAGK
ncbi:MAG: 16S rRNA (cytidine(1402)-2'-O)-methyltransferase [Deltaproteobacteria bacterium]|nr:16S rRNA (cytidine(1402)-2'-O)-methyltransferase [Deltaproteobacteria bacterium]